MDGRSTNTASRTRRSQADRRAHSARELIAASLELVTEQGVSAATFANVGQRAGFSRGLAFAKFGSKEGLIRDVIAHLQRTRDQVMLDRRIHERSGLDALLTYVAVHFEALGERDVRAYFQLLAAAVADLTEARALFAEAHTRVRLHLGEIIQRGIDDGSIRPLIQPDAAALMVGSLLLGVSIQYLADPAMALDLLADETQLALKASFASTGALSRQSAHQNR